MTLRLVVFGLVFGTVWLGGHWYAGRRLVPPDGPRWLRVSGFGMLSLLALVPPTMFFAGRGFATEGTFVPWLAFTGMGLSSLLLVGVLAWDLVRTSGFLTSRLWSRFRGGPALPPDPSRRGFLQMTRAGLVGGAGALTAVGLTQALKIPDVVEVDVPIDGLPPELEGFRIVQLSDVHVGPTIRRQWLQKVVDRANALDADLVAVTGDLIDGFVDRLRDQVAPLAQLRGRHGAFFVTGNHEYYWDGPAWCDHVASLGFTVLNNEHRVIEHEGASILVAGVTDHRAGDYVPAHRSDPGKARAGAPTCDLSLLLAHQPRSLYEAAKAGYHLQISGHTHGGQYFPMNILVHLFQPWVAGLHLLGKTWIYVSRGTGYWGPPMRVGAPSEITLLHLRRA